MKNCFLLLLVLLFFHTKARSQNNQDDHNCSLTKESALLIKQKLLENRRAFSPEATEAILNKRTITYIPLSIYSVAQYSFSTYDRLDTTKIHAFVCALNDIYLDQNIQFFIFNGIKNKVSQDIHNNASSILAQITMATYQIAGTINIIIGSSVQNQTASWYDPQSDYIFLLKSMVSSFGTIEAHEIGHFFTLPHTFYGWEGINAELSYANQNAPVSIYSASLGGFHYTENVARTGIQANCATEGDAFCDTPADYYSTRTLCPYNPTVKDSYGSALLPDDENIMSYANTSCMAHYSAEQKAAIALSVATRFWLTNTLPANPVSGIPSPINPLNGAQLGSVNDPTVRLEWSAVTNATRYYLEVVGTSFNGAIPNNNDVKFKGMVYGNNYFDLPTVGLVHGETYCWRIKAEADFSYCAPKSSYHYFRASNLSIPIEKIIDEYELALKISPNPIQDDHISISIATKKDFLGYLKLIALDGREVVTTPKTIFENGKTWLEIPTSNLSNGIYVVVLFNEEGHLQEKISIQR